MSINKKKINLIVKKTNCLGQILVIINLTDFSNIANDAETGNVLTGNAFLFSGYTTIIPVSLL